MECLFALVVELTHTVEYQYGGQLREHSKQSHCSRSHLSGVLLTWVDVQDLADDWITNIQAEVENRDVFFQLEAAGET